MAIPTIRLTSLDDIIEQHIGKMWWKQFMQFAIISFAWFFDAQQTFISIFADKDPKATCTHRSLPKNSGSWDYASTISQWSVQCASPILKGLPAASFLLGCVVGGLALATLADSKLGRKNMLVMSCVVMSISGGLTAISNNIWMYIGLRFISGFGRSTIGTCAFVLGSEIVGKKWRGKVGVFGMICYTLGFLSLPIIAYFLRNSSWRFLYVYTCLPCFCYSVLVYSFAYESPRWFYIKGKKEHFLKTINSLSSLSSPLTGTSMEWTEGLHNQPFYSSLKVLFSKTWARKRLLAGMVASFGLGMANYGTPLSLGGLPLSLYKSTALNAVTECVSTLILFLVIGRLSRRISVIGLCVFSGACTLISVLVKVKRLEIGFELVSFFCACMAYNVLLVYTAELFPTTIRNSAMAMLREACLVGGFLGPVLVAAGGKIRMLSYGVFGVAVLVCGLFVICLPETKGTVLCDSVEEEESKAAGDSNGADNA
ncbi:hypothetical protein CASFOL_031771 [Castilleja foliolosa]|uniref:Major facilitator superfamily (MFS) profile domain-containing protein n=1 Tax=Castilleja foliolosa TaxID=1961234 RepID=A0ABD3C5M9_9LAMI